MENLKYVSSQEEYLGQTKEKQVYTSETMFQIQYSLVLSPVGNNILENAILKPTFPHFVQVIKIDIEYNYKQLEDY